MPALGLSLISALSEDRIAVSANRRPLSVIAANTNANNASPPNHPPPLALYGLLYRLDRLSAPDLPIPIPPLLPPTPKNPDRARDIAGTLRKSLRRRFPAACAAVGLPLEVSMGASGAVGVCEFVSCVSAISYWYLDLVTLSSHWQTHCPRAAVSTVPLANRSAR